MTETPEDAVRSFCAEWASMDISRICERLADDVVYVNGPAAPVVGRSACRSLFEQMARGMTACTFEITSLAVAAGRVHTERIDHIVFRDRKAALAVAGVFVVDRGAIVHWREYFDRAEHLEALGIVAPSVRHAP